MRDVGTKALNEFIDCPVQATLTSRRAEKIELDPIAGADQIVGDHANQAEWTRMVEPVEEFDRAAGNVEAYRCNCRQTLRTP